MSIEDPTLVLPSRKAARRRSLSEDLMRTLTKFDRATARVEELTRAATRHQRRIQRLLARHPRLASAAVQ